MLNAAKKQISVTMDLIVWFKSQLFFIISFLSVFVGVVVVIRELAALRPSVRGPEISLKSVSKQVPGLLDFDFGFVLYSGKCFLLTGPCISQK